MYGAELAGATKGMFSMGGTKHIWRMLEKECLDPLHTRGGQRHVHLDEDFHGPLSLRLLNDLCENEPMKIEAAVETAKTAITARIEFWDGVLSAISHASQQRSEEVRVADLQ